MSEARCAAGWFPAVLCLLLLATPASASPLTVCPTTIEGALTASSPKQSGQRLYRDAVPSTCGNIQKTTPVLTGPSGDRAYNVYQFTTPLTSPGCYTFTVTTKSGTVQAVAYTSYVPSYAVANYLADTGNTSALETMSLTVNPGNSFEVAVVAVTPGETATYTLDVAGCTADASVALSIQPNPLVFGVPVTFQAFVSGNGATPTGIVAFIEGATQGTTTLGTAALDSSGSALLSIPSLAAGTHSIVAAYRGNAEYLSRTSAVVAQVVDPAGTNTKLQAARVPQVAGQPSILIATVDAAAPSRATPTGTVEFFLDGTGSIGKGTLAGGRATLSTAALGSGLGNFYAVYGGDGNFSTSTSGLCYQRVETTWPLTLVGTPSAATYGTPVLFDLTVSAGAGGTPSGTVTFKDDTTTLAVVNVSSGTASLTVPRLAVGTHTIVAEYSGDANHDAEWMSIAQTVDVAPTTTALASTLNPSASGQSVTFSATVSSSGGIPTGLLAFYDGTIMVGSATLDSGGHAAFTTSSLAAGAHSLTVAYRGDGNYAPSTSAALAQQVDKAGATVRLMSPQNPERHDSGILFYAPITVQSGTGTPTGNVSFYDNTGGRTLLGTAPIFLGEAVLMLNIETLAVGTHAITAEYEGDANFNPASSPTWSQSIAATVTRVTLGGSPYWPRVGDPVQVSANVAFGGTGGTATGTVVFSDEATTLGAAALDSNGQAFLDVGTPALGRHLISAAYGGDGNYDAATGWTFLTVNKALTTTVLSSSANPSHVGQLVTLTGTVASLGGTPTGTVLFKEGATTLGTVALDPSGIAHLDLPNLPAGDHVITVRYSGSTSFEPSATAEPTQVVAKVPTTINLTSSSNPVDTASRLTLTATLETVAPAAGQPTGVVTFMDGPTPLGSALWGGTPVSMEAGGLLSGGPHNLTAVYAGDATFATSTSPILSQTVTKSNGITVTLSAVASSYGLPTTLSVTLKQTGRYPSGIVTFSEGGTTLATKAIDQNGVVPVLEINSLDVGSHAVTATYGGDAYYLPASAAVQFVVKQRMTGLTLSSSDPAPVFGQPFTLTASLSRSLTVALEEAPQGPLPPVVGNVTFSDGPAVLGTIPIPNGSTTMTVSTLSIGWHDLSARYEGSNNHGPSEGTLRLEVVRSGTVDDAGSREGGSPDAGQDSGSDASMVMDGRSPVPESGPAGDGASMDATVRDGGSGDVMAPDAADAGTVDTRNADATRVDGAGDGSPALPPSLPDGGTSDGGCGCHTATQSSGGRGLAALGLALGLVAIRRRDRRKVAL